MNNPAEPMKVAVVGCGAVAQVTYARTLPRVPHIRTTYVHDLRLDAAQILGRKLGARVASMEEITAEADAVIISTPPSSHYDLVKRCLAAGTMVVCEKPFVGSRNEAEELVQLAEISRQALYVGHFRRTFPAVRQVREIVASGVLGEVIRIDMAEGGRFSWNAESGYVSSDPFGGVLFDTGSHTVDMALSATGLDQQPLAVTIDDVLRDRAEPSHEIFSRFKLHVDTRSIDVSLRLSRFQALANQVSIHMEHGRLSFSVSPRSSIRMTGPTGSTVLHAPADVSGFDDCFVAQWRAIFGGQGAETFSARNFIGLTSILEAISQEA